MTAEQVQEEGAYGLVIREQDKDKQLMLMERLDLDQAMAELHGEVVDKFVYTVPGGRDRPPKRQLSYAGVKEAARLYKNVHFGATAQQMPDGSWVLNPFAHNLSDNLSCSLPLPYPAFDAGNIQASIAYRATLSKSVRMALAAVLPITYLETMISKWAAQQGGTPQRSLPAQQVRNVTPPDPHLQDQRKRLAELLAHFPDAAAAMGDKTLPDHLLTGAVAKLEARFAADVEADNQEQLADALELARTAIDHVSKKRGGPTVDDASAMRDVLTELQRLDPRDDDRPAREIASKDLVAVIAKRLPATSATTPEAVGVSGTLLPDDQPF